MLLKEKLKVLLRIILTNGIVCNNIIFLNTDSNNN